MTSLLPRPLPLLLLLCLSSLPFLPGLSNHFIFDDIPAVLRNKDITAPSPRGLLVHDFWGGPLSSPSSHKSYRPLTSLTFWLQAGLAASSSAWSLKLANLALHATNSLLLYMTLSSYRLLDTSIARREVEEFSLFSSLIFACHPLHVEPVVSIVGRADLLYTCLLLTTCLLALHTSSLAVSPLLLFLSFLCLLSKEQGIILPLLWAAIKLAKSSKVPGGRRELLLHLLPPLLTLPLLTWLRLWTIDFSPPTFQPGDNPAAALDSPVARAINYQYAWCVNLLLLVWPQWLCFDWALGCLPLLPSSPSTRLASLPLLWLLLLLLSARCCRDLRAGRLLLPCSCSLLLLPFLLSTNLLVTVGFVLAERALYLSVAGSALLVARGVQVLGRLLPGPALRTALALTVAALAARAALRSGEWATEMDLFTSGLSVCPCNAKVHYNIAKKRADLGHTSAAVLSYREAVRLSPHYEHALNNLGNLEKARGDLEGAELLLRRAKLVNPEFAAARMNLAIVLQARGQTAEAETEYLAALELRSPYADCEYNLANLYLKLGRHHEAEVRLRAAAGRGHSLAWTNLVLLLQELGQAEESHSVAVRAVQVFPDNPELRFHLANSYGRQGLFPEGEAAYKAALRLATRPRAAYHSNLGVLYHRWGKPVAAAASYRSALALQPGLASARDNLARLLAITT